jgi:hypothetical protein
MVRHRHGAMFRLVKAALPQKALRYVNGLMPNYQSKCRSSAGTRSFDF